MSNCINISHPQYKQLLRESNLPEQILKAKLSIWMVGNNVDVFPTLDEVLYHTDLKLREAYFSEGDVQPISSVLKKIASYNQPLSAVARYMLNFVSEDHKIRLVPTTTLGNYDFRTAGLAFYNEQRDGERAQVAEFAAFREGNGTATILHEIIHLLTVDYLYNKPEINQDFEKLLEYARTKLNPKEYGLTNTEEFIVALFTDADLIVKLQDVAPSGINNGKYRNLFEELFHYILGIFKITPENSLYKEAFAVATNILKQSYQFDKSRVDNESYQNQGSIANQASEINYQLKAISLISSNLSKVNNWWKQLGDTEQFWSKIQKDLQIPKEQLTLLSSSEGSTIEEKLLDFSSKYSYNIEINTTKNKLTVVKEVVSSTKEEYDSIDAEEDFDENSSVKFYNGVYYYKIFQEETPFDSKRIYYTKHILGEQSPTQYYSNLTVSGGTNYTENEIATPGVEIQEKPQGVPAKEGVQELFESNPELASIGTQEQYSQYLDTIFPDSKVKDIVYRGSEKEESRLFQYFTKNSTEAYMYAKANITKGGKITERNPISIIANNLKKYINDKYGEKTFESYILDKQDYYNQVSETEYELQLPTWYKENIKLDKQDENDILALQTLRSTYDKVKIEDEDDLDKPYTVNNYDVFKRDYDKARNQLDKYFNIEELGQIKTAILNIKNPYIDEIVQEDLENDRDAYKNGHDGAFLMDGDHFLVKSNTEQIHILGSKQDIEGFKNFIKSNTKIVRKGAITPSIKGHAQFATNQGIGWFRSDDRVINTEDKEVNNIRIDNRIEELQKEGKSLSEIRVILTKENEEKFGKTKTRRILEVQSDLYQKSRDIKSPDEIIEQLKKEGKLQIKCN